MKALFQRAGISLGLARLLLADPTTLKDKISELKRATVRQIHPDANRQIADSDFGAISAAFDELQNLTNDQLVDAAYKIDHPDESQGVELMELQLHAQNLEKQLEAANAEAILRLEQKLADLRSEYGAFISPVLQNSAKVAAMLLWEKPLEIHQSTLLSEDKLDWVTNSLVPKTRLSKLEGSVCIITPNSFVVTKPFSFSLNDEGVDTSSRRSRFIGGSYNLYDEKLQEFIRTFRIEIETGNPPPRIAGILLGFARRSPALSRLINQHLRRHRRPANALSYLFPVSPTTTSSSSYELSYSRIKEVCQPKQPLDDDYYLVIWRFGAEGVLTFERYRTPQFFSVRP